MKLPCRRLLCAAGGAIALPAVLPVQKLIGEEIEKLGEVIQAANIRPG